MNVDVVEDSCHYIVDVYSAQNCPVQAPPLAPAGATWGTVFLLALFCCASLYMVCGSALNMFKYKQRGRNIIPNLAFWQGIPSLTLDGCIYTYTKVMMSIKGDGYASI
ncbi:autophagy-related protein 27, partial [Kipferlia bialata]|eukprot:g15091.t1